MGGVGSVQDEVELEGVRLVPVLLDSGHEVMSTHGHRILLLAWGVGENVNLSAKGNRPEHGKVAKTTHTDNSHLLARSATQTDQWAVYLSNNQHTLKKIPMDGLSRSTQHTS